MPTTDRKLRVFLCHASQDKPVVRELYQQLLDEGWVDPWLDEEKLLPGQDWDLEIEKAVVKSHVVIVCLSGKSVSKEGYIQKEVRKVLDIALEKPEETIFIIPLRLDEVELPRRLRPWHYVDYFPADRRERVFQRLLQSLKLREEQLALREAEELVREQVENELRAEQEITQNQVDGDSSKQTDQVIPQPMVELEIAHLTKNFDWVKVSGSLNSDNSAKLMTVLDAVVRSGRFNIVLDLRELKYISSSGLLALMRAKRACRNDNRGDVVLVVNPGTIYEVLDMAGFIGFFKIVEDPLQAF